MVYLKKLACVCGGDTPGSQVLPASRRIITFGGGKQGGGWGLSAEDPFVYYDDSQRETGQLVDQLPVPDPAMLVKPVGPVPVPRRLMVEKTLVQLGSGGRLGPGDRYLTEAFGDPRGEGGVGNYPGGVMTRRIVASPAVVVPDEVRVEGIERVEPGAFGPDSKWGAVGLEGVVGEGASFVGRSAAGVGAGIARDGAGAGDGGGSENHQRRADDVSRSKAGEEGGEKKSGVEQRWTKVTEWQETVMPTRRTENGGEDSSVSHSQELLGGRTAVPNDRVGFSYRYGDHYRVFGAEPSEKGRFPLYILVDGRVGCGLAR